MSDFIRDYTWAEEHYATAIFTLRGRLDEATVTKAPNGNTFVKIKLLPRDQCPKMIPVIVNLAGTAAPVASRLKPGEIVEIGGVSFSGPPVAEIAHEIIGFGGNTLKSLGPDPTPVARRDALIAWLKKNNAFGPTDDFVTDMTKLVDSHLAAGEDFSVNFGPGLMQSKKTTNIGMIDGKFFSLALTDAQAKPLKLDSLGVNDTHFRVAVYRTPGEATFDPPVFTTGTKWNVTQPLKGKIKLKTFRTTAEVPGEYALRMTMILNGRSVSLHSGGTRYATVYDVSFTLPDDHIADVKSGTAAAGPHIAVFEISRQVRDGGGAMEEVISDAQIFTLDLSAK